MSEAKEKQCQPFDAAAGSASWRECQTLLNEAIAAVNALSVALEKSGRKERMYLANQAIHKLWDIEKWTPNDKLRDGATERRPSSNQT